MDEQDVVRKARAFMQGLDLSNIRESLDPYLIKANARVREEELGPGESGTVAEIKGKLVITVNSTESLERQRFTICHELGHKVLGLDSSHQHVPQWGHVKRDMTEILCDVFAAELLMPHDQFSAACRNREPSLATTLFLMDAFKTSFPATGSRFARLTNIPCAFINMQGGLVRYAALSTSLRRLGARITLKTPIPARSLAARLRQAKASEFQYGDVAQDEWFENWPTGLDLIELSRHHDGSDTTLSLLWCEEEDVPRMEVDRFGQRVHEDTGLDELTGFLSWKKK
ncbi:ImmA/IrrE family metallo-endopeptidase [Aquabacterium sp.]|uniref:ImmA/IrrE family metallo-endopeptidase n=1 Tax=Aquabacterium sp. TaxID=1872578 RepID=UPI0035B11F2A